MMINRTVPNVTKSTMIEKYNHHGTEVSVQSHLRGRHREHCLCFQDCKFFKPATDDNCEIAQANYELCVKYGTTQPMWECPKYEVKYNRLTPEMVDDIMELYLSASREVRDNPPPSGSNGPTYKGKQWVEPRIEIDRRGNEIMFINNHWKDGVVYCPYIPEFMYNPLFMTGSNKNETNE